MIAYTFQKYSENFAFFFLFINKNLRLKNLKTRTAVNANTSVSVVCVEAIIYLLLLYNLHDCALKITFFSFSEQLIEL